jgi:sugar fermentation stimulation protein A
MAVSRRYAHTLEIVQPEEEGPYVGVHSASANAIVAALLASGVLKHVLPYHTVQREVVYGAV